ncbi:MAG TPA: hypothetical protein DD491_10165 [Halieaceae bacterium]|nr:hypothetical protein [Halieaceae bacterium]
MAQTAHPWPEISRTAVVSTAHLPEDLAQAMERGEDTPFAYDRLPYGFRLFVLGDLTKYPATIRPIAQAACRDGCRWLEFDADVDTMEGFAAWSW